MLETPPIRPVTTRGLKPPRTTTGLTRQVTLVVAALATLALGAAPAAARPEPGPMLDAPVARAADAVDVAPAHLPTRGQDPHHRCALQRIGAQYVVCDDLTGNGVPAPGWLPAQ